MKLFMCKRQDKYSGGLAVVAANSAGEAFKTFYKDERYEWLTEKWDNEINDYTDDYTKWVAYDYPIEHWFECKELTANVDKPCVIMEDGYTE